MLYDVFTPHRLCTCEHILAQMEIKTLCFSPSTQKIKIKINNEKYFFR